MLRIIDCIADYRDLSSLGFGQLEDLSKDIRKLIVDVVSENGGHLASSLGAVDLIIALLRVFDPLEDKIVFDVGHQAYAYKILTDRKGDFKTLRKWGGISGFPDPKESPFDHFNAGHSSKSLSAALGFAKARDILGQNHSVLAVIGDGSLMNGLALEALNNANEVNTPVIFVLNDNQMSINRRVGGVAKHLAALSVNPAYRKFKNLLKKTCSAIPQGEKIESFLERTKHKIKGLLQPANMFENIGISYWGPFDGHNIREMEMIFRMARNYDYPLLIHLQTQKGRGFGKAEEFPVRFHGLPPGGHLHKPSDREAAPCWSQASASCIENAAVKNDRIVCLTAAMMEGSKLNRFAEIFPDRFFDVGIAEGHLLTFAAGMASAGLIPIVSIYSTFLQRAMDQLVHDICMQNLPVILTLDRSGLVGEDGETHHGILDLPWSRPIPNLTVMSPRDTKDLRFMFEGSLETGTPCIIRLPRGPAPESIERTSGSAPSLWGESEKLLSGSEWAVISFGSTVPLAVQVFRDACSCSVKAPSVYDLRFLKPLDVGGVMKILSSNSLVVVLEESSISGGIGEKISSIANYEQIPCQVKTVGIPDKFIPHGTPEDQWELCGLVPREVIGLYHAYRREEPSGSGDGLKRYGGNPKPGSVSYSGRRRKS